MGLFDPTVVSGLTITAKGDELLIRWSTVAALGTTFQVYVGNQLAWVGTATRAIVGAPSAAGPCRIVVGSVPVAFARQNLIATAPDPFPADRATLRWEGGTYLAVDLCLFRIYGATIAGGSPSGVVGTVPAYPGGIVTDGFGFGSFGAGRFGFAASSYSWTSGYLSPGTWNFEVRPVTTAGIEGPGVVIAVPIVGPPRGPRSIAANVDPTTGRVLVSWSPSPTITGVGGVSDSTSTTT